MKFENQLVNMVKGSNLPFASLGVLVYSPGTGVLVGPSLITPQATAQRDLQIKYDGAKPIRSHILRYGISFNNIQAAVFAPALLNAPLVIFNTTPATELSAASGPYSDGAGNPLNYPASLVLVSNGQGYFTDTLALGFPASGIGPDHRLGVYAGDSWKLRRNFTVNSGIRYDRDTGRTDSDLRAIPELNSAFPGWGNPVKQPNLNFAPQLGMAWDPLGNGKTVIRGGLGLYYENVLFGLPLLGDRPGRLPTGAFSEFPTACVNGTPLPVPVSNTYNSSGFITPNANVCIGYVQAPEAKNYQEPVFTRAEVVRRIAELQKISTPEGIQIQEQVQLGGVKQWISIRGLNRSNPVILMIHGGPGDPVMPEIWGFQKPWEDFFTVVQWDQRGVGKNWNGADHAALALTLTTEQIIADASQLVSYLRKRLNKDKIVVMGWSYGTTVGCELVARHPEEVSAYVAIGQTTPGQEEVIYSRLLTLAAERGNRHALSELKALAPYPVPNATRPFANILLIRKWVQVFNGAWYGLPNLSLDLSMQDFSPEYSAGDASTFIQSADWFYHALEQNEKDPMRILSSAQRPTAFRVPVVMIMGIYDLSTPYSGALKYFNSIKAPRKRFITLERSAHFPFFEQPGEFLKVLIDNVLPLSEGAAPLITPQHL